MGRFVEGGGGGGEGEGGRGEIEQRYGSPRWSLKPGALSQITRTGSCFDADVERQPP